MFIWFCVRQIDPTMSVHLWEAEWGSRLISIHQASKSQHICRVFDLFGFIAGAN